MMQFINVLIQRLVFPINFIQELHKESLKNGFTTINMSFKNESKKNDTTLAKYVWDLKLKHNVTPTLRWHILKSVAPYSNITKKCRLCLQEKFEFLSYPNLVELLSKRSELVSKCRHVKSFCQLIIKRTIDITFINTFSKQNDLIAINI